MSVDKSLVSRVSMTRARNVYSRAERLEILKKDGRLSFEGQVLGLPKTRVEKVMKKVKAAKEKKAEEGAAVAGAPGAAPAAGAAAPAGGKPAAGAKPGAAAAAPAKGGAEKKPAKK
jgi:small basic protein (TIGR04137 family)